MSENLNDSVSSTSEDTRGGNVPEGSNETPNLPDKGDEHTDAASFLREAVNGIGNHHGRDQLVSDRTDGRADNGGHIPVTRG
jgi:hypothetical protein